MDTHNRWRVRRRGRRQAISAQIRRGGDEFVVLISEIAHPNDAGSCARKILLSLNSPHSIGRHDLHVDCSIGISIYPKDGEDEEMLIKNADAAMYCAKEKGQNNFQFFETAMRAAVGVPVLPEKSERYRQN